MTIGISDSGRRRELRSLCILMLRNYPLPLKKVCCLCQWYSRVWVDLTLRFEQRLDVRAEFRLRSQGLEFESWLWSYWVIRLWRVTETPWALSFLSSKGIARNAAGSIILLVHKEPTETVWLMAASGLCIGTLCLFFFQKYPELEVPRAWGGRLWQFLK